MTLSRRGRNIVMLFPVLILLLVLGGAGAVLLARLDGRIDVILIACILILALILAGLAAWHTYPPIFGSVRALSQSAEGAATMAALREKEEHVRLLLDSTAEAIYGLDLQGNCTWVNQACLRMLGYPDAASLLNKNFHSLVHHNRADGTVLPQDECRVYQALARGDYVHVDDEVLWRADGTSFPVEYWSHPLRRGEELIGAVVTFLDITERKRAEANVQRLALLQCVVADLGQRALRLGDPSKLLGEATSLVAWTLGVEFCNVAELLPGGDELILRAGVGWKEGLVGRATVKSKDSQAGYTVRTNRPVIVEDTATETRFVPFPRLMGEAAVSSMSVVIPTPDGPYGTLGIHTQQRRTFTRDEVNYLQAVANVLGSAIQRQRSEERLRRSNRSLVALSSCNQALIRATDEAALLHQVCQIVIEEAGYRLCWVGYANPDEAKTVQPVAQAGVEEDYLQTVNVTWADSERGRGPTGTCIRTGQPVVFRDLATDPAFAPWRAEAVKRGYASSVSIPLITNSTTLGALTIYAGEPDAFGDDELKLLTELANDLAFGVKGLRTRAERAASVAREATQQREVEIGFKIQQTLLLNQPPIDVPGLRIAALTIPSRKIDGDFYAFYQHENQHLDVIVADVMGKGIPAALLGAATRSQLLEALCHLLAIARDGRLPEPREIVTLAHAKMVQHLLDLDSFVTLCYLRFDLDRRSLDLVDCGHTGVIHRPAATGHCQILHGENLPLGIRIGEIYKQLSVPFQTDDLFLLFSDGVTEMRNREGDWFGEDRLLQCVQRNSGQEPAELVQAIQRAVFAFSGSEAPTDDWTCVAMKVVDREVPLGRAELEIGSSLGELPRARTFIRHACHDLPPQPLDEASVGQLELAVTEACCNIMKHAYHGQPDQRMHLEAEIYPDRVSILLHHLGDPFDPTKAPPPAFDGSRESGFGLYLITQSVDGVRYFRDDRGRNCIALVKNHKP